MKFIKKIIRDSRAKRSLSLNLRNSIRTWIFIHVVNVPLMIVCYTHPEVTWSPIQKLFLHGYVLFSLWSIGFFIKAVKREKDYIHRYKKYKRLNR